MSYKIQFSQWLMHQLQKAGATAESCEILHPLVLTIGLVVLIAIADFVSRKVILTVVARYAKKSNNTYDDILVEMRVFIYLAHVVPALVAKKGLLFIFNENSDWVNILQHLIDAYIIIAIIRFVQAVLRAIKVFLLNSEDFKDKPIGSYTQLLNIINYAVGILFIISNSTDKPLPSGPNIN